MTRPGLLALLAVVACTGACTDAPKPGITLWHSYSGAERTALETTAAHWNTDHPDAPLMLVAMPHDGFADKVTSAIPGGNGPDLFIYAHDRVGAWAEAGVLEPIEFYVDDARADRFSSDAIDRLAYHGSLWGLPLTQKALVLYYRTDLVATAPATTDDLVKLAPKMKERDGFAFAYSNVDLYGHAPWLHAFGGTVMDDTGTLAIASPEAANAMAFARDLVATGVVPANADNPLEASLFNAGRVAAVMSGPWFATDIRKDVPWAVATLPIVSPTGRPAAPYFSTEGVLMSARARDKDAAFAVMDTLTSDAAAVTRAQIARQVVPNVHAWDDAKVAADPFLRVFRTQIAHSVPMPKTPVMRMVWTPYADALGEVISGRAEPGAKLNNLQDAIQKLK